ncbi:hypothetical protein H2198_002638 [Neophaeococcomyces mojaviensis]|uniref:Uncharacterized protein n=1 Tax=Neophaeococcomyces mojaviensis TaxID=3383035 RepID=A0ACC3ADQ0_9EURO|nr:hypothetical protein H2198_002638 [Knufia sp. JES_112]
MASTSLDVATWFDHFDCLSEHSPALELLQPVIISKKHLDLMNDSNRECKICHVDLDEDSVQHICCRSTYHRECLVSYVSYQPETRHYSCPWCRTELETFNYAVLIHLSLPATDFRGLLDMARNHLLLLQSLPGLSRVRFMQYVEAWTDHGNDPDSLGQRMRVEALRNQLIDSCRRPHSPQNRNARSLLDQLKETGALFIWFSSLVDKQNIITTPKLADAPTRYGKGPNMFEPVITEEMKVQKRVSQPEAKEVREVAGVKRPLEELNDEQTTAVELTLMSQREQPRKRIATKNSTAANHRH